MSDGALALWIALLGALGSLLRYGATQLAPRPAGFPLGTLAVNVLGSLAIGLVTACFGLRADLDPRWRIALSAGLLGGFTTFSAFSLDLVQLLERRAFAAAALYLGASLGGSLLACWLALRLR